MHARNSCGNFAFELQVTRRLVTLAAARKPGVREPVSRAGPSLSLEDSPVRMSQTPFPGLRMQQVQVQYDETVRALGDFAAAAEAELDAATAERVKAQLGLAGDRALDAAVAAGLVIPGVTD